MGAQTQRARSIAKAAASKPAAPAAPKTSGKKAPVVTRSQPGTVPRSGSSEQSTLGRYFRELANHPVLTPDQEIELAKAVEAREVEYWLAIFAYPACIETVALVLKEHGQDQ